MPDPVEIQLKIIKKWQKEEKWTIGHGAGSDEIQHDDATFCWVMAKPTAFHYFNRLKKRRMDLDGDLVFKGREFDLSSR